MGERLPAVGDVARSWALDLEQLAGEIAGLLDAGLTPLCLLDSADAHRFVALQLGSRDPEWSTSPEWSISEGPSPGPPGSHRAPSSVDVRASTRCRFEHEAEPPTGERPIPGSARVPPPTVVDLGAGEVFWSLEADGSDVASLYRRAAALAATVIGSWWRVGPERIWFAVGPGGLRLDPVRMDLGWERPVWSVLSEG